MAGKPQTDVPFVSTPEQDAALEKVFVTNRNVEGCLMPVMQQAQDIFGYLPYEVQHRIAEGLDIPLSTVYGVATFYSQFNLNPKGKYRVGVCLGTACYVKNAAQVYDKLKEILNVEDGGCTADGLFSLDATRCLGCCGLAPVLMVNDDVYGRLVPEDVEKIVEKYRQMEAK